MFARPASGSGVNIRRRGGQPKVARPSLAAAFRFVKRGERLALLAPLIIAILILGGCSAGYTKTAPSAALIEYRRGGGFVGLDDHLVISVDGQATLTRQTKSYEFEVDSDTMDQLQTLLDNAGFRKLRGEYLPPREGSDFFEYVVTYKGHTVRTMDTAVPESLQSILELLNQIVESGGKP